MPATQRRPPALRRDLLISELVWHGSRPVRLVRDPRSGRTHELGVREHYLLSRLDGSRTLGSVGTAYRAAFGRRIDAVGWHELLGLANSRGLLAGGPGHDAEPLTEVRNDARWRGSLLAGEVAVVRDGQRLSDRLLRPLGGPARRLRGRPAVGALLVVLSGVAAFLVLAELVVDAADVLGTARDGLGDVRVLLVVAGVLWASAAVHEVAHALVARAVGGSVGELGVRWRLPLVVPFCRVEDYRYLPTRARRLATAVAGCGANLLLLLVFGGWWILGAPSGVGGEIVALAVVVEAVLVLANLLPFPPLDGYVLLMIATSTVGLAAASRRYLRLTWRARLARAGERALARTQRAAYPRRLRRLYSTYALTTILVWVAMLGGASIVVIDAVAEMVPQFRGRS